ncbi:hypothetical protein AU509_05405 [Lonsdalea britannica]|nr:hypothetical protein AU509_05405 [Lonsdalea britannica]
MSQLVSASVQRSVTQPLSVALHRRRVGLSLRLPLKEQMQGIADRVVGPGGVEAEQQLATLGIGQQRQRLHRLVRIGRHAPQQRMPVVQITLGRRSIKECGGKVEPSFDPTADLTKIQAEIELGRLYVFRQQGRL